MSKRSDASLRKAFPDPQKETNPKQQQKGDQAQDIRLIRCRLVKKLFPNLTAAYQSSMELEMDTMSNESDVGLKKLFLISWMHNYQA